MSQFCEFYNSGDRSPLFAPRSASVLNDIIHNYKKNHHYYPRNISFLKDDKEHKSKTLSPNNTDHSAEDKSAKLPGIVHRYMNGCVAFQMKMQIHVY